MIWEIMRPENLLFVLVDYQENFLPLFKAKHQEVVKKNILLMVKMFTELKIPMIGTDHYRNGLGATDKNVLDVWNGDTFKDKITFSCCKNDEFKAALICTMVFC